MALVHGAKAFRKENLNVLAEELFSGVAEELLGLMVHQSDTATAIHHHRGVGGKLNYSFEGGSIIATTTVRNWLGGSGCGHSDATAGVGSIIATAHPRTLHSPR
jgi:hypothetical protein